MKKISKANALEKTVSLLLSFVMILVIIPVTAVHADGSPGSADIGADELYSLLNEATGIAGAFNGSSRVFHDYDENDTRTVTSNGRECEYARLKGDVDTMQKLKEKLAVYFSQSIADYYMSVNERVRCIAEFDGKLYYLKGYAAQRMNDELDQSNSRIEVIGSDDGRIRFRLTVSGDMDEARSYVYELERRGGSFFFTDYVLPSEIGHNEVPGTGNPQTSDAPLIAVCALALSALAAAVVLRKKR